MSFTPPRHYHFHEMGDEALLSAVKSAKVTAVVSGAPDAVRNITLRCQDVANYDAQLELLQALQPRLEACLGHERHPILSGTRNMQVNAAEPSLTFEALPVERGLNLEYHLKALGVTVPELSVQLEGLRQDLQPLKPQVVIVPQLHRPEHKIVIRFQDGFVTKPNIDGLLHRLWDDAIAPCLGGVVANARKTIHSKRLEFEVATEQLESGLLSLFLALGMNVQREQAGLAR